MVEGEKRVGLPTPEVGLELHYRVGGEAREALQSQGQQIAKALGQKGATEELLRVLVFLARITPLHLGQIGGELG